MQNDHYNQRSQSLLTNTASEVLQVLTMYIQAGGEKRWQAAKGLKADHHGCRDYIANTECHLFLSDQLAQIRRDQHTIITCDAIIQSQLR